MIAWDEIWLSLIVKSLKNKQTLPLHYLCISRNSVYVFQTEHEVHSETNVTQSKQRPKQMRLQEAAH